MNYTIPGSFSLEAFISACLASGLRLEYDGVNEAHGSISLSGVVLSVYLNDPNAANKSIVAAAMVAQGWAP